MEVAKRERKPTSTFSYSFGMFGTSIPINMFKTFAAFFYVDKLGLITMPQFSTILLLYTFLDAIDNPVYGFLSDCTHTKWGRRRPWLVTGAPLLVLSFIMFFNPPASLAPGSAFSYVLLAYMMTGTLDSLINVNYGALFPELFRTQQERAKTNAMRQIFQLIAMILSIALTPVVTDALGYSKTALVYGVIAIAVIWFMAFSAHEDPEAMEKPRPRLLGSIKDIISTPKFWIFGVANAAFAAAFALIQAGVPFYAKYYLEADGMGATILLGVAILSAILFIPVWVKIIKKITFIRAWRAAFLCMAISIIPLLFAGNLAVAAVMVVIVGFGIGGVQVTMDLVGSGILDEDAQKHGVQREGTFASMQGILNKSSGLFVSLGYFLVFRLFGFESGTNTGMNPGMAARFLMILFPCLLFVICIVTSRFLKFSSAGESK